jgi:hypothetical protein
MNISPCFNPQYPQASGDFFTPGLIRQSAAAPCRHQYFVLQNSHLLLRRDMVKNRAGGFPQDRLRDYPDNMNCCTAIRDNMPFSFASGF